MIWDLTLVSLHFDVTTAAEGALNEVPIIYSGIPYGVIPQLCIVDVILQGVAITFEEVILRIQSVQKGSDVGSEELRQHQQGH